MEYRSCEEYVLGRLSELEAENERLSDENDEVREANRSMALMLGLLPGDEDMDERFCEVGREKVFKDSLYIARKAGGMDFDEWCRKAVYRIPDWMSRDEYLAVFDDELRDEYERQGGSRKGEEK